MRRALMITLAVAALAVGRRPGAGRQPTDADEWLPQTGFPVESGHRYTLHLVAYPGVVTNFNAHVDGGTIHVPLWRGGLQETCRWRVVDLQARPGATTTVELNGDDLASPGEPWVSISMEDWPGLGWVAERDGTPINSVPDGGYAHMVLWPERMRTCR